MKSLIALILPMALAACSSPGGKQQAATPAASARQEATAKFARSSIQESSGSLSLVFDAQGNWESLTSTGTAGLSDESPGGRETTLMIATLRGKRAIAEFLDNDIKSAKTLTRIARAYARTFQSSSDSQGPDKSPAAEMGEAMLEPIDDKQTTGAEQARQARHLAATLSERIQDSSSAILKGVYVSHRSIENGQVIVEVTASRQSVEASRQISGMMRGALQ